MKNNKYICHAPYLMNSIAYDHDFWYTFVKWWYLHMLFPVSQNFEKEQKMVQNDKTLCLSHSMSQEPYIIWLSFMIHMRKMVISAGIFFIFSKFWFFGSIEGVKGQKIAQNDKKLCLSHSVSQEPYMIYCDFWFTCVKWCCLEQIVSYFRILILGAF